MSMGKDAARQQRMEDAYMAHHRFQAAMETLKPVGALVTVVWETVATHRGSRVSYSDRCRLKVDGKVIYEFTDTYTYSNEPPRCPLAGEDTDTDYENFVAGLSPRSRAVLENMGCRSLPDVQRLSKDQLLRAHSSGLSVVNDVAGRLSQMGLRLHGQ